MNKKKAGVLCLDAVLTAVLLFLDQYTKRLAVLKLKGQRPFILIQGVLQLEYLENRGSAFGVLQGKRVFLLAVGVVFLAVVLFFLLRLPMKKRYLPLHFLGVGIIAGGLGNMIDRFFLGYVVDFIYFILIDYPIFNVADCFVVVSTIALFVLLLFYYKEEELEALLPFRGKK